MVVLKALIVLLTMATTSCQCQKHYSSLLNDVTKHPQFQDIKNIVVHYENPNDNINLLISLFKDMNFVKYVHILSCFTT